MEILGWIPLVLGILFAGMAFVGFGGTLLLVAPPFDAAMAWRDRRRQARRQAKAQVLAEGLVAGLRADAPDVERVQIDLADGTLRPVRFAQIPAHQRLAVSSLAERLLPAPRRKALRRALGPDPLLLMRHDDRAWRLFPQRESVVLAHVP